jgi:hypothetical protein
MADTSHTPAPGSPNSVATLQSRLDQLQRDMAHERRRATRTPVFTILVGIVAIALLSAYFYIGYSAFKETTEPEKLVNVAEQMIDENLPQARRALEDEIKRSAPTFAESLSSQAQAAAPKAREKAVDLFIEQMEKTAQEATILSEDHFKAYIRANKDMLNRKFEELSKNDKLAQKSLEELEAPLETEFGGEMKIDGLSLSRDIGSIAANLKYLAANKNLTDEQRTERRWWMLARALFLKAGTGALKDSPLMSDK